MIINSTQVNSKKEELKNALLEERIKRRKDNISQVLYMKRKIHQIQFQPFQDIIKKYPSLTRGDREETLRKIRPVSQKVQKKIPEKMLALQVSQPPESQLP